MEFVRNIPTEIEKELYAFSDWFFNYDLSVIKLEKPRLTYQDATSAQYLQDMQSKEHKGYPEESYGADFLDIGVVDVKRFRDSSGSLHGEEFNHIMDHIHHLDVALKNFVCSPKAALKMYYPPDGYIGWHHNANAHGYNILFTYSETGEGAFLYQHPITKEIVEMKDKKGWSAKVGCYDVHGGSPLWHAAYTKCNRLNWAYVIPEHMWHDVAEEEFGVDVSFVEKLFGTKPSFRS